jgi:hypothetical protein
MPSSSSLFRSRAKYPLLLTLTVASTLAVAASCATSANTDVFPGSDGGNLEGSLSFDGRLSLGDGNLMFPQGDSGSDAGCSGGCTDFPAAPVNDPLGMVPGDPTTLFPGDGGTGTTAGGPCLSEPAEGALYPYNWLRPRVLWASSATETVFEVRISAPGEENDYVVYTTNHYWSLDKPTWQKIAGIEGGAKGTLVGVPISVVVRATTAAGGTPTISNAATFQIAPAIADGSLIFWSTQSFAALAASTNLQGFHVGDEGTTAALTVPQVQQKVWAGPPDGGDFPQPPVLEPVGCIGCHAATPDGNYVGFTAQWPWPNAIASVQAASAGAAPPWLTVGAIANLGPNTNDSNYLGGGYTTASNNVDDVMLGAQTFSAAHYATGDRVEVTSVGASMDQPDNSATPPVQQPIQPACNNGAITGATCVVSQLAWINLEWAGAADAGDRPSAAPDAGTNGGWGILARTGDTASAGTPNWSNDGQTIAYTSVIQGTMDGRLYLPTSGSADIKTIPYNAAAGAPGGAGGAATSVPGASDPASNEYFPAFSPDDSLLAFNRVPAADSMYNQPLAEVYVVPYNGGTTLSTATCDGVATMPCRLKANDPVACTGLTSPGVQNTWPKWAPNPIPPGDAGVPAPQTIDGFTYYWVTFSSTRSITAGAAPGAAPGTAKQQLYVAGVVVDSMGNVTTYAPIYLSNQDDTFNNLIPAWGEFSIPPAPTPPAAPPIPPPPK